MAARVVPSILRSAGLIAVITVLSKCLGLIRDQLITHFYGASLVTDAYFYAFQIPSFVLVLLGGLGGPFHTATVSILSKLVKEENSATERLDQLVRTFWTATGLVFSVIAVLVYLAAPALVELLAHHASDSLKALTVWQLQWMTPMIVAGSVVGIFCGVSNVFHKFFWPSFAPSAINVTLILWLLCLGADPHGFALCASTSLGAILQVALQLPDYFRLKFSGWPAFHFSEPALKTMAELFVPQAIGTSVGQLNIYVAMFFVSQLEAGGWTAFVLANRLIQLPIGVLSIALLVPLFPRFARWVEEQDLQTLGLNFKRGVLALWLVSFPMIALMILLAEPGIAFLFERGAFTHHDTVLVAYVLIILSLSVIPYMLRDMVTRVFYAFNDSRTPLIVGLLSILINAGLNMILVKPLGVGGIALSTVLVTVYNALVLGWLSRRHLKTLGFGAMVIPTIKMLVAFTMAFIAGYGTLKATDSLTFSLPLLALGTQILAVICVVTLIYSAMVVLLRIEEAALVVERVKERFNRR